jgi:penicillin-binding protein 1C
MRKPLPGLNRRSAWRDNLRAGIMLLLVLGLGYSAHRGLLMLSGWVFPVPRQALEHDYASLHLDRRGQLLHISLSATDKYRLYLPLEEISPFLRQGFLAYEDRYFFWHQGVNPPALLQAFLSNVRHGRTRRGGSTLTMQLAKLLEPKPRTLRSKIIEIIRAWQLEGLYSKRRLLELYLNRVPMGGNIEGVGAAAYLYFGKPADELSLAEACLLIGIPKSPGRFRPDQHPEQARAQRNRVLARIAPQLRIAPARVEQSLNAEVISGRRANPFHAPHLVLKPSPYENHFVRVYTVNPQLQDFCAQQLSSAHQQLKDWEVHNGAVMVVDNRSMQVLAYVGTRDFKDAHGGQIDAAAIRRSPGSLLKPFLYARAMEQGLVTAQTWVADVPRNYDGYEPDNYDRRSRGPLPAEEALLLSLNNPAIHLEAAMGTDGLQGLMKKSCLAGWRLEQKQPGLSLVVGALPMSLEEMVQLYTVLANQGRLRQLQYYTSEAGEPNVGVRLLSEEACFLISEILAKQYRPDLPQAWEFTANRGKVAYKTGTSFGMRDAWTIGYTPDYTVGVWLGNVDAQGSSALLGSRVAAPLMIEIMNELTRYRDSWFTKPAAVGTRLVCARSGEKAGPYCLQTRSDYFIPGISREHICQIHQQIIVDQETGWEVCPDCMRKDPSAYRTEILEVWPPEIASFLRKQGQAMSVRPSADPKCQALARGSLKITSPMPGGIYRITKALPRNRQRIALEVASQQEDPVYWYLNDQLVGQSHPDQPLFITPLPGEHQLTAVNTLGQTDQVVFRVGREK